MKKKRGIHKLNVRIFLMVLGAMVLVITSILAVQVVFLDDYYYRSKVDKLIENTEELTKELEDLRVKDTYMYEYKAYPLIDQFNEENGVSSYIETAGYSDELAEMLSLIMTVVDEKGDYYYMYLDSFSGEIGYDLYDLEQGEEIYVEGFMQEGSIFPSRVNETELEENIWFHNNFEGNLRIYDVTYDLFDGWYEEDIDDDFEIRLEEVFPERIIDGDRTKVSRDLSYYQTEHPFSKVKSLTIESHFEHDVIEGVLYVETSLQSVSEIVNLMMPFYVFFYVISFIVALISARILSKNISRPIEKINNKARAMARLDFSEALEISRGDEVGELADTMNVLSMELDNALVNLKSANQELLKDIEREREIESNRKAFIANVSHELKTPLGIARGYIEAILDGIRKDKQEDYLHITLKELKSMNTIILNLLELMKYDDMDKRIELSCQPVKPYFDEMAEHFSVLLHEYQMELDIEGEFVKAVVESRTFKSLLINLISNSIQYGVNGTKIHVVLKHDDEKLKIRISNKIEEGMEIDLERIWHKFYTNDSSHNRKTSGTGLGLSIVRSILDKYNSEYDIIVEGNRFIFEFDLKKEK